MELFGEGLYVVKESIQLNNGSRRKLPTRYLEPKLASLPVYESRELFPCEHCPVEGNKYWSVLFEQMKGDFVGRYKTLRETKVSNIQVCIRQLLRDIEGGMA